ncbi:MAG: catalytic domain [Gemmatimonadales bacterium]|nr:catalytic domain [Gemmatimonadales bacterium]
MGRQYYVYIMTNPRRTVLYTGITNNLLKRVWQHRNGEGGAGLLRTLRALAMTPIRMTPIRYPSASRNAMISGRDNRQSTAPRISAARDMP